MKRFRVDNNYTILNIYSAGCVEMFSSWTRDHQETYCRTFQLCNNRTLIKIKIAYLEVKIRAKSWRAVSAKPYSNIKIEEAVIHISC